jgi:hypothetical protein
MVTPPLDDELIVLYTNTGKIVKPVRLPKREPCYNAGAIAGTGFGADRALGQLAIRRLDMANQVIGSVLVGIGIIFDAVGLYFYIATANKANKLLTKVRGDEGKQLNLGDILDAINKFLDSFAKLTTPAQIALLGSFHIVAGIYMFVKKPL